MSNTRLLIFSKLDEIDENYVFSKIIRAVTKTYAELGYNFPLVLPINLECVPRKETFKEKKFIFFGEEINNQRTCCYVYCLCFNKELTEEELVLWRMFKLGRASINRYESS